MKILQALKLLCLGAIITAVGICLRGHDILTGAALSLLALLVMLKLFFACRASRGGGGSSRPGGDQGGKPILRPPGGRPPTLRAQAAIQSWK
jgi:hypothetical protein